MMHQSIASRWIYITILSTILLAPIRVAADQISHEELTVHIPVGFEIIEIPEDFDKILLAERPINIWRYEDVSISCIIFDFSIRLSRNKDYLRVLKADGARRRNAGESRPKLAHSRTADGAELFSYMPVAEVHPDRAHRPSVSAVVLYAAVKDGLAHPVVLVTSSSGTTTCNAAFKGQLRLQSLFGTPDAAVATGG